MLLDQTVVPGLGHLSTFIADESSGVGAVIDPRRDVDVYLDQARAADIRITTVVETHLHNDYVSGARELASLTGATHVIGAGAELRYEHRPLQDGETFDVGYLRFQALHTPGHTPEHMSYAVVDASRAGEPLLVFTGGSLLVGAVGRTDLLGEANAVAYAHDMHRSLKDVLLPYADFVSVFPTHGAGSLCSTGIASTPWSTIGYEKRHNPMVRPIVEGRDIETFVQALLGRQPAVPTYFARMRPMNQNGPAPIGARVPDPRPMDFEEARAAVTDGAQLVDLRSPAAFAVQHAPGALSIPAGSSFGTWLGWLVEPDRPLVLDPRGPGAVGRCRAAGAADRARDRRRPPAWRVPRLDRRGRRDRGAGPSDRPPARRRRRRRRRGGAPRHRRAAAHRVRVGPRARRGPPRRGRPAAAPRRLPRDRPIAMVCASGYRSSVAASLVRGAGFKDVSWVAEGGAGLEGRRPARGAGRGSGRRGPGRLDGRRDGARPPALIEPRSGPIPRAGGTNG